jgi:hypothetical protein
MGQRGQRCNGAALGQRATAVLFVVSNLTYVVATLSLNFGAMSVPSRPAAEFGFAPSWSVAVEYDHLSIAVAR